MDYPDKDCLLPEYVPGLLCNPLCGSVIGEGHGEPKKVGRTSLQRTATAEILVPAITNEVNNRSSRLSSQF